MNRGKFGNMNPEGCEEALAGLTKMAGNTPPADEAAMNRLRADLGDLIDRANRLGVDPDFLNPLTEMMMKLSSNALTHQAAE